VMPHAGRPTNGSEQEEFPRPGVVAKMGAKYTEGAWRVAESAGSLLRGLAIDEIGAERLVLAMPGGARPKKKGSRVC